MTKFSKQIKENLSTKFPNIKFTLIKICTSTSKGIKKLNEAISDRLKDETDDDDELFPYVDFDCNSKWLQPIKSCLFELANRILAMKESNETPIITFNDFCDLASECYIMQDNHELVSIFLRHIGVIHHYRDSEIASKLPELENLIFIDISMYVSIVFTLCLYEFF